MEKTKLALMCIIFLMLSGSMHSQLPISPHSALSPNAASLGLYGDIPVSLYTGTPDIEIPLYEMTLKNFKLPISLTYHASGIRPDQHAGWTGLGWSLKAGGVISRAINDIPDEYNNINYGSYGDKIGFYYTHDVLNTTQWNQRNYLREIAQDTEKMFKDTAPDEFTFSFGNYYGKFYIAPDGNWNVQCNRPVKVKFNDVFLNVPFDKTGTRAFSYGYFPCFSGFTIIGEDGTKFEFGGNINAIDFSVDFFNQALDEWVATSWYLTQITLPTGHQIKLEYERGDFINQMYIAVHHDLGSKTENSGGFLDPECSSWSVSSIDASYQGKLIAPAYLKNIKSLNSTITFSRSASKELAFRNKIYDYNYSEWSRYSMDYPFLPILQSGQIGYPKCLNNMKWYKLDSIDISIGDSKIKTINFTYNNKDTERLVLEKVKESDNKSYSFTYNNVGGLPPYLSNKTDHWGYFNNTYASLGNYNQYYNYRNSKASYLQYGILTSICYPTGGCTEFVYEPHYYRKQLKMKRWEGVEELSTNQLAGGLRIKQIWKKETPDSEAKIFREYFYVSDYLTNKEQATRSSGVLGGRIQYYFTDYTVYAFNSGNIKRHISAFSSISVLPACHNTSGSHIGYSEVIEKYPDGSYTQYQYSNFDNGYLDEPADAIIQLSRTPYEPYNSKAQDRGLLLTAETYNNKDIKVKSKSFIYEKDATTGNYVRAMNAKYSNVCPGTAVSYDEGTSIKIYTYLWRPQKEKEVYYNAQTGQQQQTTQTDLTYTSHKLIRSKSTVNSNGNIYKESYQYPFDFSNLTAYQRMIKLNRMSPIIKKTIQNNTNEYNESFEYKLKGDMPYLCAHYDQKKDFPSWNISYISETDAFFNPIEVYTKGIHTVYIWGYNGCYPIAEIVNATLQEVTQALGFTSEQEIVSGNYSNFSSISALRKKLPRAQITTYTYKPFIGMLTSTAPNGVRTFYKYDYSGRLSAIYIRDANKQRQKKNFYYYHYQNQ